MIEMSGPIFDTLNEGKTLIVNELDAKLHPLLTRNIVLLFMDPQKNQHGAQLIFATHDTNLLDLDIIRRDQIWFAEKDDVEATDIYSLVEFKDENGKKCVMTVTSNTITSVADTVPYHSSENRRTEIWATQEKTRLLS